MELLWIIIITLFIIVIIKSIKQPQGEIHKQINQNKLQYKMENWGML